MFISNFNKEEFGKKSYEPYIKQRPDTDLLNTFCSNLEDKVKVTVLIVNSIYTSPPDSFSTSFHVAWAMEFLGYSFSLPIEHHEVITKAFSLYRKWILGEDSPACIKENESMYQEIILGHLSLLFTERSGATNDHSRLCINALILMKELTEYKNLSETTWKTLLKVLLLISNSTLTHLEGLSQHISPYLLTTLFWIWIKSSIRDYELWAELERDSALWLDHLYFVTQWDLVVYVLTKKVASLLYDKYSPDVMIEFLSYEESENQAIKSSWTLKININAEKTIFLWHKFLTLMLNNTKAKIPGDMRVYKTLSESIKKIIDVFLGICDERNSESKDFNTNKDTKDVENLIENLNKSINSYYERKSRLPIPSADSILEIFGEWLFFNATVKDSDGFVGSAVAMGSLCNVVCKAQGPINQAYLERFYRAIQECCLGPANQSVIFIYAIKESQNLFSLDHRGVRLLAFDDNFLKLLSKHALDPKNAPLKVVCCAILCNIVGLNHQLGNPQTTAIMKTTLMAMIKPINEIVFKKIIWILAVLAMNENEADTTEIVIFLINLLSEINYIAQKDIYGILLECLYSLPYLIKRITKPAEIIEKLCWHLSKMTARNVNDSNAVHLFVLVSWFCRFPECFDSNILQKIAYEVLRGESNSKSCKKSAEFTLEYLKNALLSNFSYKHLRIESGIINFPNNARLIKHFFYKPYNIFSIYETSIQEGPDSDIFCILRNCIGKYVWSSRIIYKKKEEPVLGLSLPIDECEITENAQDHNIDLPDDEQYDKLSKIFCQQSEILKDHSANYHENYVDYVKTGYCRSYENKSYRVLLSQFGLFHDEILQNLAVVEGDVTKYINELDQIFNKSQMIVPIIYLENSESKIFDNQEGYSERFVKFLNNLGIVLTDKHANIEIFSKISNSIRNFKKVIYSSDNFNEILFVSPCMSENISDTLDYDSSLVVWNERANDRNSRKIPSIIKSKSFRKKKVILLMPFGVDIVNVKRFGEITEGPLLDEMNITIDMLPELLMRTLVNNSSNFKMRVKSMEKRIEILTRMTEEIMATDELTMKREVLTQSFL